MAKIETISSKLSCNLKHPTNVVNDNSSSTNEVKTKPDTDDNPNLIDNALAVTEVKQENGRHEDNSSNTTINPLVDTANGHEHVENASIIETEPDELVPQYRISKTFKNFYENWKGNDDSKKKQKQRNEINDTFIFNTGVTVTEENIDTILDRGDFFTARRIWDKSEGKKFHDHFVFVTEKLVHDLIIYFCCHVV